LLTTILMLISSDFPHTILSSHENEILGYSPQALVGQSFGLFSGPRTDNKIFFNSVQRAGSHGESGELNLALYDIAGRCRNVILRYQPSSWRNEATSKCCHITVIQSESILFTSVFDESAYAWALVSADRPHYVETVNDLFTTLFGLPKDDIVGKNLHRIRPSNLPSNELRHALLAASQGTRTRQRMAACTASDAETLVDIDCIPVVSAPGAAVTHIMAVLSPTQRAGPMFTPPPPIGSAPSLQNPAYNHESPSFQRIAFFPWPMRQPCMSAAIDVAHLQPGGRLPHTPLPVLPPPPPPPPPSSSSPPNLLTPPSPPPHLLTAPAPQPRGRPPSAAVPAVLDDKYVRRVRRRHLAAERRAAVADADASRAAAAAAAAVSAWSGPDWQACPASAGPVLAAPARTEAAALSSDEEDSDPAAAAAAMVDGWLLPGPGQVELAPEGGDSDAGGGVAWSGWGFSPR
jgi:hypothetical protein